MHKKKKPVPCERDNFNVYVFWLASQAEGVNTRRKLPQHHSSFLKLSPKLSVYVQTLNKCNLQPSIKIHESAVSFLRVNDLGAERQKQLWQNHWFHLHWWCLDWSYLHWLAGWPAQMVYQTEKWEARRSSVHNYKRLCRLNFGTTINILAKRNNNGWTLSLSGFWIPG